MRWPLLPTLLVAAAVATMIGLGVWQLGRAKQKDALLARYEQVRTLSSAVPWPRDAAAVESALYRASSFRCERVLARRATAGRSAQGQSGWSHLATCALDGGGQAEAVLGWSRDAAAPVQFDGGELTGFVGPGGGAKARLVVSPPVAPLEANAAPDPRDLPNNHLAYAGQWFFFAAAAAVIYGLALRRRQGGAQG